LTARFVCSALIDKALSDANTMLSLAANGSLSITAQAQKSVAILACRMVGMVARADFPAAYHGSLVVLSKACDARG